MRRLLFLFFCFGCVYAYGGSPTVQCKEITVTSRTCTSVAIAWHRGNGEYCLVTCRPVWQPRYDPPDSAQLGISAYYGQGSSFGYDNFGVYMGPDSSVLVRNLSEDSTYIFQIYELNAPPFYYLRDSSPADTAKTLHMQMSVTAQTLNKCYNHNLFEIETHAKAEYNIQHYLWKFDDTTYTSDSFTKHHFSIAGYRNFSVQTLPAMGCKEELAKSFVYIVPGLKYGKIKSISPACMHEGVLIADSLEFDPIPNSGYAKTWYGNKGDSFTTSQIIQTYDTAGVYKVHEVIYMLYNQVYTGCADTLTGNVKINSLPVFHFNLDTCVRHRDFIVIYSPVKAYQYMWGDSSTRKSLNVFDSGFYKLTITDSNLCRYTDSIFVDTCNVPPIIVNGVQNVQKNTFTIYPVPANNKIHIRTQEKNYSVRIYNLSSNIDLMLETPHEIDASSLPNGIYLLQFYYENSVQNTKIMVLH